MPFTIPAKLIPGKLLHYRLRPREETSKLKRCETINQSKWRSEMLLLEEFYIKTSATHQHFYSEGALSTKNTAYF